MKAFLMYKDKDFNIKNELPPNEQILTQDLELNTLFNAMSQNDEYLFEVAKRAVLSGLDNSDTIRYRQQILRDCLKKPVIVRELYNIAVTALQSEKKNYWGIFQKSAGAILNRSVEMLQIYEGLFQKLKKIADEHKDQFESEGFRAFFSMINNELNGEYLSVIQNHIRELQFRNGVFLSAELGKGNKGTHYQLHQMNKKDPCWLKRIFRKRTAILTLTISDRDVNGSIALAELKDRGINRVANILAQSSDHILSYFKMMQVELAFYLGCINLHEQLIQIGEPISFPQPLMPVERKCFSEGLYDICLALTLRQKVVGNNLNIKNNNLVIITGANQGGKSTFLRSIGLAQLMMQCGMFVPAEKFCSNVCDHLFTHYKREEDISMNSGKLDEELRRMSDIVDYITSDSIVLFNESFAATNEREGSEIARQIVTALLEKRIKVFFVTHLYQFANNLYDKQIDGVTFLRAERKIDGARSFKLFEGKPLQKSYGEDLYNSIFGTGL